MKIHSALLLALAAAAVLPGSMHASTVGVSPVGLTATFLATDFAAANSSLTGAPSPAASPAAGCSLLDPTGCGIGGNGCTDSPENPTALLGMLGIAGLLLGSKTRGAMKRRRMVPAIA